MRKQIGVVLAVALTAAGSLVLLNGSYLDAQSTSEPVVVTVKLVDGKIVADPDPVEVTLGGTVRWTVVCLAKDQIAVKFSEQKGVRGPFAPVGETAIRGQFATVGPGDVLTGVADQLPSDASGKQVDSQDWKYSITWTSGNRSMTVDPAVRIRGGGT